MWSATAPGMDGSWQGPELPPIWKLLLLSDGSVTRHLQALTGEPTEVDVIGMERVGEGADGAPAFLAQIPGPRLRRQVWLRTATGQRLAYAVSWWPEAAVDAYLKNRALPIWASLAVQRTELYREILQVLQGRSQVLEEAFGCESPIWGRYYLFWHDRKPLTLIFEAFSPRIGRYL